MTASPPLEDRLRRGLRAAAEVVPPPPETIPVPGEQVVRVHPANLAAGSGAGSGRRRRRTAFVLATAAALAALAGTAVVLTGDDGDADSPADVAADSSDPTTTTAPPHVERDVNGMVPGRAIANIDLGGLRTFGPDGQPTGTVDLAPLETVSNAASDLAGGWVACGGVYKTFEELNEGLTPEELDELEDDIGEMRVRPEGDVWDDGPGSPTTDGAPVAEATREVTGGMADVLMWFPAEGEPVELDGNVPFPGCIEGAVQVVDSPDGPVVLRGGVSFGETGGDMHPRLEGILLPTGERRELRVPALPGLPMRWSLTTGKALTYIEGVGLQLFDLETTQEVPIADIDPGPISHVALAYDGKTAAVLTGPVRGPVDVVVYDLASGAELFRKSIDMSAEGDEVSYDGTTLAVGNFYADYGPVRVIDVATGAEHTLDAHGVIL